jgi:putative flippase GtrA
MTRSRLQKFLLPEAVRASKYVVAGAIATAVHYATMATLVQALGAGVLLSTCIGYTAGAFVKYPLNHRLVFASGARHREAVPRFAAGLAVGFLLNAAIFSLLLRALPAHYMVAQVLTTGLVILANYLVARLWVFRDPPPDAEAGSLPR